MDFSTDWQSARRDSDSSSEQLARPQSPAPTDQPNQNTMGQFEATLDRLSLSRTMVSTLSLPFIATLCGNVLLSRLVKGNVKRSICVSVAVCVDDVLNGLQPSA